MTECIIVPPTGMSPVRRSSEYDVSVDPFSVPGLYSSLLEI